MSFVDLTQIFRFISRIFTDNIEYRKFKIRGRDNIITKNTSKLSLVSIDVSGSGNDIIFGDGSIVTDLEIYINGNNNKIIIGNNCRFIKDCCLWIEDDKCEIIIGDSTSFISAHLAVTETKSKIIIGYDCMFAYDIDVRTGDSHSILDVGTGKRINYAKNVEIGNHVWVASHVRILKGVKVMDNCIIGTGSVVTKTYDEANVIYAGVPAKIVKKNISWCRERL